MKFDSCGSKIFSRVRLQHPSAARTEDVLVSPMAPNGVECFPCVQPQRTRYARVLPALPRTVAALHTQAQLQLGENPMPDLSLCSMGG